MSTYSIIKGADEMSAATTGAGAAATQQAAIVQAIKASGAIVQLEPSEFAKILAKSENPLVVTAEGGVFTKNHQYITNYKGLHFYCKSPAAINLPLATEVVQSKKIWIPG